MWFFIVVFAAFAILVIVRMFHFYNLKKTNEQVAKIHATKLTMDDVVGKNLPPDPGAEADKTVAGIDANKNGIRDDVELAIFKAYPDSAKTRAVLLQYALALQMETMQSIVNRETVTEVVREQSRAHYCVGEIASRDDIKNLLKLGTSYTDLLRISNGIHQKEKNSEKIFVKYIGSYSESENEVCDINLLTLSN